jgi:Ni/Co efflux regulator RcnB
MKSTAIVCAIAVASLGFSSLSQAQGRDRRGPDDDARWSQQDRDRHGDARENDHNHRDGDRHDDRYERGNDRRAYYDARGPEFYRGGHIPYAYRGHQYVVNNYYVHRLPPPARGHQWVQVGADYVLIAIATGVIAQIILGH